MKYLTLLLLLNVSIAAGQQHACFTTSTYKTVDAYGLKTYKNTGASLCINDGVIAYYTPISGLVILSVYLADSKQVKNDIKTTYVSLDKWYMISVFPNTGKIEIQEMAGTGRNITFEGAKMDHIEYQDMVDKYSK